MATFQGNPTGTVISAYSSTSLVTEEDMKNFCSDLHTALESVPVHNILFVLGDFNGRLGSDEVPHSFNEKLNCNGQYLIDLMEEHALTAANTRFQKPKRKLWTWLSPPDFYQVKHKQQIDFILVRRKWQNSILDAQAFS